MEPTLIGSNTAEGRNLAHMNARILHYQLCTMPNRKVLFNAVLQPPSNTILAKCLPRVNSQWVDGWIIVLFIDQLISLPISPITFCHLDRENLSKGHTK